ncbi:DUF7108 family protein [Halorientalis halophila]|uniref:DUF7108 family protein n=1 Tax=Halorientalis halophila TaxID=3108499 RepID=UPI003008E3A4
MTDETRDPDRSDVTDVAVDDATDVEESTAGEGPDDAGDAADVPPEIVDEVERLTRLADDAVDDAEAEAYRERRASLLDEYEYRARVREDDAHDTLVLHPEEWLEDGVARLEAIEDTDRGIERPLGGPGDGEDWEAIDDRNREIAAAVAEAHGTVHGENAAALADFMSNHYAKPIDAATEEELAEFVTDYFRRNAWPSDEQRDLVDRSVELARETADSLSGPDR